MLLSFLCHHFWCHLCGEISNQLFHIKFMRQSIITRMNECWFEFSRQIWWPNLVANQAVNSTKFWICFLTISNSFVIKVFYAMYLSNIRSLTCFSLFIGSMKHLKLFCLGIILHVASDFFFSWEIKWSGERFPSLILFQELRDFPSNLIWYEEVN